MGQPGEISLCTRANCACTDISPLACTAKNAAKISAGRKSRRRVENRLSIQSSEQAGSPLGRPPLEACPWPAAASEQPSFREAQIALRTEHQVVVHRNVQEPP